MIPNIFDCQYIDNDNDVTFYYECELTVDLGPYKAGTILNTICINYEEGTIEIFETEAAEDPHWRGKIVYTFEEAKEEE